MPATDPTAADEALRRALLAIKDLKARVESYARAATEPIAIIGAGCRFPGGADSPEAYWDLLRAGRDAVTEVPAERWDHAAYFDPDPDAAGKIYTDQGGFLIEPVDQFDAAFFGIAPVEARSLDPQQRILLEVTWEALENAGIAPDRLAGSATGVFVGMGTNDYSNLQVRAGDPTNIGTYYGTGLAPSIAAGRISYVLGLQGPALMLDTACSSSLTATSLAVQSLRAGACRMALAGGVNLMLEPQAMVFLSKFRALSPTGRCHTFGADADGYVRGEGCGMIVLKRLSDAQADGDRVVAVIRAATLNHDGRSSGLTVPSGAAQREVIEQALSEAGLESGDIDLIEAHGTGTQLGDPIEVRALDAAYSQGRPPERPLLIGSAKTNIGHLEAAAGVAGLLKVALALQHEEIPAHLHCDELSPHIDWTSMPIEVARHSRPWPRGDRPRRAGISAYGFSGTNAHVILEEAPPSIRAGEHEVRPVVIALAARDEPALATLAHRTGAAIGTHPLADVAWTTQDGRARFAHRLAVTAASDDEARSLLQGWSPEVNATARPGVAHRIAAPSPRVAFLFTGQGAQLPRMGRDLYEHEPVFRSMIDRCDLALRPHLPHGLVEVMLSDDPAIADLVHRTQYTQPAMFALQCALAELWRSWAIVPSAVAGHSIGEYAAAVSAGVMDLPDAAELIAARGRLMGDLPAGGAMVAVFADERTVDAAVAPHRADVAIAAINGPANVVVSGTTRAVDLVIASLAAQGIRSRPLRVSHAFHSPSMDPIVAPFGAYCEKVSYGAPGIAFVSSVTGDRQTTSIATADYWRDHVGSTVRFADAVTAMVASGIDHFVEIGPQPTLLNMVARLHPEAGLHASLRPGGERDERAQIADALGTLWASGVEPDWRAVDRGRSRRTEVPTYPFQRQRFWVSESATAPVRVVRHAERLHPLVHHRIESPAISGRVYASELSAAAPDYLGDHRIFGVPVLPATGHLEIALAAARHAFGDHVTLARVALHNMLVLPEEATRQVQVIIGRPHDASADFSIQSGADGSWTLHASGTIELASGQTHPVAHDDAPAIGALDVTDYYATLTSRGAEYGPDFTTITSIERGQRWAKGTLSLSPRLHRSAADHLVHPALLDGAFQLLGAALRDDSSDDSMYVPVEIGSYRVVNAAGAEPRAVLRTPDFSAASDVVTVEIELLDEAGQLLAEMRGVKLRRVDRKMVMDQARKALAASAAPTEEHPLYELGWAQLTPLDPRDEVPGGVASHWLVVGGDDGVAGAIAANLEQRGARAIVHADASDVGATEWAGVVFAAGADASWSGSDPLLGQRNTVGALLDLVQRIVNHDVALAPSGRLWVVTRNAQSVNLQADPVELSQTSLWGMAASVAAEEPGLNIGCIDLAPRSTDVDLAVDEMVGASAENRIALRGGRRFAARLGRARRDHVLMVPEGMYALAVTERGTLDGVVLQSVPTPEAGPGEVLIEVRASGVNFRDVLNVMGMYPGAAGDPGSEVSGVVVSVGSEVTGVAVGDEVIALVEGSFKRYVTARADLVFALPPRLDFADGATLPIAFLTVHHGLHSLANIRAGDTVLVHAAAGGVGMAAVQIARRAGATVIGTAGSDEKRSMLRSIGVAHVLDSRSLDFAPAVLEITGRRGVDIALNSLADDFIPATLGVVADGGTFLEIGKRGIWTTEQVAEKHPTIAYHVYDLADVLRDAGQQVASMMADVVAAIGAGDLAPLPHRTFPIAEIRTGLRHMAMARHVGKVVITQPQARSADDVTAGRTLDPAGAYVITGGSGALGLQAARTLARLGAGHIALLARRALSDEATAAVAALASSADVRFFSTDVTDAAAVATTLEAVRSTMGPIRGVIHASGVLGDGMVRFLDWPRVEHVLAPKVLGAWNLHTATTGDRLDLFVMYSSAASLLGSSGQSNYAAANAFLDGLAHHRQARGLPGLSINWGGWSEAGMAAELDESQRARWAQSGIRLIDPEMGDHVLAELLDGSSPQVGVLPIDWRVIAEQTPASARPPLLELVLSSPDTTATVRSGETSRRSFSDDLAELEPDERVGFVREHIRDAIVAVLGLETTATLDSGQGLPDLGMDSLMAAELSNRLQRSTGLVFASTAAFEHPSLDALTLHVTRDLLSFAAPAAPPVDSLDDLHQRERIAELEAISEAEAELSLLEELRRSGY